MDASNGRLTDNPFEDVDASFSFGDAAFSKFGSMNMNKAKRLGWTGFVDTMEVSSTCPLSVLNLILCELRTHVYLQALFEMYFEMGKLGMVPQMKVDKAKPLV